MPAAKKTVASSTEVKETETKNQKFRRLATARLVKATAAIAQLGGLASKAYEYNANEVKAIMIALEQEAVKVAKKLNAHIETASPAKAASANFDPFAIIDKAPAQEPQPDPAVAVAEVEAEKKEPEQAS